MKVTEIKVQARRGRDTISGKIFDELCSRLSHLLLEGVLGREANWRLPKLTMLWRYRAIASVQPEGRSGPVSPNDAESTRPYFVEDREREEVFIWMVLRGVK